MTLVELQRALTSVEPAAVLVPPRVVEKILREVLKLSGMVFTVPHAASCNVERTLLFRHVDQADLVLAPDQVLPANVLLLSWPSEEELQNRKRNDVLLTTWRQLFHASLHQALDRAWDDNILTPARLREHIEAIGPTAFEEIRTVLREEKYLLAGADDRAAFDEFAAVFLELHHFSPSLLPSFFPGLQSLRPGSLAIIKERLDRDIGSDAILARTRLPGAPESIAPRENVSLEANEYFHRLETSSQTALAADNMVAAAIDLQTAVRVAPADLAPQTRLRAEDVLGRLLDRMKAALELTDPECAGWSRLLPILLDKADQGSRPAEAALLYDLQDVCIDHEREMYKLDVVEYVLSAGRRPLKRPLPSQRIVRIARTLRGAVPKLMTARLSERDRAELQGLLQKAVHRSEDAVRSRFRPILSAALTDVGLSAKNPLERVAFNKMVEDMLDRIIDYGFLTFSDLRDTISRNQLKLPDLVEPQDFIRGDPLIRLDRRLATNLDGVYRPGEFYLRWLERFTSWQFGTKLGRMFTWYVTLPVGGGFLIVFALIRIFHLRGHEPTVAEANRAAATAAAVKVASGIGNLASGVAAFRADLFGASGEVHSTSSQVESTVQAVARSYFDWINLSLWFVMTAAIFALLHSPHLRSELIAGFRWLGRSLRTLFVQFPIWLATHATLAKIVTSTPTRLIYWYVLKPGVLTAVLVFSVERLREVWYETLLVFLAANFLINSRPGEVIGQSLLAVIEKFVTMVRAGLIPGLIRFIERAYKQVVHSIEGALFKVDEWLRFRGGDSDSQIFFRSVATLIWMPISYLARFNLIVLIEPCFHPLKFPVVTVATKFYLPFVPIIRSTLTSWCSPFLPGWLTFAVVWWLIFWLPDVFGFIFWEMKENWSLFRANRRQAIEPIPVGSHGETIRGLFQPGFHSGTLPKAFARIRHAETRALASGNYSAVRHYRAHLQEIEESLKRFADRELAALLAQSPAWRDRPLTVRSIGFSSNLIRFDAVRALPAESPAEPAAEHVKVTADDPLEPLSITFENRAGWIVVGLGVPSWVMTLSPRAEADLHNALVLFYKMAGVDLIREQIRGLLPSPDDHFDFVRDGLQIWSADRRHDKPMLVDLRSQPDGAPLTTDAGTTVLVWDADRVIFRNRPLSRDDCLADITSQEPRKLFADLPILPARPGEESPADAIRRVG